MVDDNKRLELIEQLGTICEELGWYIAVNETDLPGIIAGPQEFVSGVLDILEQVTGEEFEVYTKGVSEEEIKEVTPKTKKTWH